MADDKTPPEDSTDDKATEPAPVNVWLGTENNELTVGHDGVDIVDGGGGRDLAMGRGGLNLVDGGSDGDIVLGTNGGFDVVTGGSGDDFVVGAELVSGGSGNDTIAGSSGSDTLIGDGGDDWLSGGAGSDVIAGGADTDTLIGGDGADLFIYGAGDGDDTIVDFGNGSDMVDLTGLNGGAITWDQLSAKFSATDDGTGTEIDLSEWGGGTLTLLGVAPEALTAAMFVLPDGTTGTDSGNDDAELYMGSTGDDEIDAGGGNDIVMSSEGSDTIAGGAGHDTLMGGEGADELDGGDDDDLLMGGEGADTLIGGAGEDMLIGGEHDDTLTGGADADVFVYAPEHGNDKITDFAADEDTIDLSLFETVAGYGDLAMTQDGANVVIDLSAHGGGTLTLQNVDIGDLDAEDFAFYEPPAEVDGM